MSDFQNQKPSKPYKTLLRGVNMGGVLRLAEHMADNNNQTEHSITNIYLQTITQWVRQGSPQYISFHLQNSRSTNQLHPYHTVFISGRICTVNGGGPIDLQASLFLSTVGEILTDQNQSTQTKSNITPVVTVSSKYCHQKYQIDIFSVSCWMLACFSFMCVAVAVSPISLLKCHRE